MDEVTLLTASTRELRSLTQSVRNPEGWSSLVSAVKTGGAATLDGAVGSGTALLTAAFTSDLGVPFLAILSSANEAEIFADDLSEFAEFPILTFPALQSHIREATAYDETYGERLRVLKRLLAQDFHGGIVVDIHSLMQPVPSRSTLEAHTLRLTVGELFSMDRLAEWLLNRGFQATTGVALPGEFARRGGILDLWAADWDNPLRMEWFGDEIESIRTFDLGSQRSQEQLRGIDLSAPPLESTPVPENEAGSSTTLLHYFPHSSWIVLIEPTRIYQQAAQYFERSNPQSAVIPPSKLMGQVGEFGRLEICTFAETSHQAHARALMGTIERFRGSIENLTKQIATLSESQSVWMVCTTPAEIERLSDVISATSAAKNQRVHFLKGNLRHGFYLEREQLFVLSAAECFSRLEQRRLPKRYLGKAIDSFLDLQEGDLVVHLSHGIARYRGMEVLRRENQVEEHLVLEFAEQTKVYVPSTRIGLVQKYVGGKRARPRLAKIGGLQWQQRRKAAEAAVNDLAGELLEIQAQRASRPGIAFAADTVWQREFDGSFPYTETEDQLAAVEAIKQDMQATRPMDRLLCGDVGFGKTEVALRAIFKAVDNGYQVGVLVPTTVLAEQHYHTFQQRMAEYPFTIARLSRFCSNHEERQILSGLKSGAIDIVIGTHRLASADVQFHNLGLLVIDEEQRFGVEVKERLKTLRATVDVLTMTATPIPRTLHMSLTGMRDISNLEQAPAERTAVETRVTRWNDDLIRQAILRELNRGGQVYFVHNRIADIQQVARRLREIVPEATLQIGHGRMHEHELEQVMLDFVNGRFDVLLATTIVESGLDIPNANTIFIDEAQRYGLADLHQLRGRVGRYNRLAYCYLLVDPRRSLTPEAARRLRAIEEFSHMGAGFAIAMRDLEFRGAGNVLGPQQSGHIAAIGYELYCELLEAAVRRLKALPPKLSAEVNIDLPGRALIPDNYVPDQRTKIDLYRRLTRTASREDVAEMHTEMVDRFGPPPPETVQLLNLAALRIEAAVWQLESILYEVQGGVGYLVLRYTDTSRIRQLARRTTGPLRIVDGSSAYYPIGKVPLTPQEILDAALGVFQTEAAAHEGGTHGRERREQTPR